MSIMRPIILDYKTIRTDEKSQVVYNYDWKTAMSVVKLNNGEKPFIELEKGDYEFATKTRVSRENDDDSFFFALGTETKVARESSDLTNPLLELQTKTFVKRESDDERSIDY
jgi:hypothetical protein